MIHITWHCALLIVLIIASAVWVSTRNDSNGGYSGLSDYFIAYILWMIITVIAVLLYGGIFWW